MRTGVAMHGTVRSERWDRPGRPVAATGLGETAESGGEAEEEREQRHDLVVRSWSSQLPPDERWHGPGDDYVWACWVSTLGPTATLAWWHLARRTASGGAQVVDLADLAQTLGLGGRLGRSGPLWRSLGRLVRFGAARFCGPVLEVRPALSDLPLQALARSGPSAQAHHAATVAARRPVLTLQARARALQAQALARRPAGEGGGRPAASPGALQRPGDLPPGA